MKKIFTFIAALTLSAGLWAENISRWDATDAINDAADAAITEIQNASTEAAAKPIQEKAIAEIQTKRDKAIRTIWSRHTDEGEVDVVLYFALQDINSIKAQALKEIKGGKESGEVTAQLDSLYTYDDDELIMKMIYIRNNKGELAQRFITKVEYGRDIPFSFEVYDYNETGLLAAEKTYSFVEDQEGKWQQVLTKERMHQYNAQGQVVRDTTTDFCEEDTVYGSTAYQYNENGNVIESVNYESTRAGEVVISESTNKTEFTYTANNRLSQEILYSKQTDSQWLLHSTTTYTYNENNLLVEVVEDNEGYEDSKMVYSYNDNKYLATKTGYLRFDDEWELDSKEEYTYDEHNNMMTKEMYTYANGEWTPKFKNSETYTEQGWLETDTCYKHEDSYKLFYIDEYTYDDYGYRLSLVSTDYMGEEMLGVTKFQYFYSYSSTALPNVNENANSKLKTQNSKFIKDGQLFIRKGDKTYTIMGVEE